MTSLAKTCLAATLAACLVLSSTHAYVVRGPHGGLLHRDTGYSRLQMAGIRGSQDAQGSFANSQQARGNEGGEGRTQDNFANFRLAGNEGSEAMAQGGYSRLQFGGVEAARGEANAQAGNRGADQAGDSRTVSSYSFGMGGNEGRLNNQAQNAKLAGASSYSRVSFGPAGSNAAETAQQADNREAGQREQRVNQGQSFSGIQFGRGQESGASRAGNSLAYNNGNEAQRSGGQTYSRIQFGQQQVAQQEAGQGNRVEESASSSGRQDEGQGQGEARQEQGGYYYNRPSSTYAPQQSSGSSFSTFSQGQSGEAAGNNQVAEVTNNNQVAGSNGGYESQDDHYNHEPAHYVFDYFVNDPHTHDIKSHKESRDGHVVKGQYTLVQPDGQLRTVDYTADWKTGFQAKVHYSPAPKQQENGHATSGINFTLGKSAAQ